ncbi:MAG: NADH-quinone oxidoreductase subunit NuoE [Salaquimonas sp.]|nr:NADH-quinone oxidoreductase subunit NuoE [Salaquimonas sp.]
MSVRRLAEEQPDTFAYSRAMGAEAKKWIAKYPKGRQASAVIPLLMLAQEQEGWVTRPAIEKVAAMLDMPLIRVLEVATFYTQFQLAPVGTKAHVQVCGTTPCMLRGSEALIELCKKRIHPEPFHTNEAGTLSWEEVECQGACVNAPMVMIFKDTYEDLTPERLEEIIDAFESGKGNTLKPGPQIDRIYSAPVGGPTTLTSDPTKANGNAAARPRAKTPAITAVAPKKTAKPAATPIASLDDKNRPAAVEKPARPDDLKLVSGVGPKIEGILHELGIFTYAQIARWKKDEREWVDNYLKFKGRIEREDWVRQAKALAKGGEAEYVKVFGKKPR